MKFDYSTPDTIIEHAEAQNMSGILDDNTKEQRLRQHYYRDMTDDEFAQLKRDRNTGLAVAETIRFATSEDELSVSVTALRQWLAQRDERIHAYTNTTPDDYRIPAHELRQALLRKVVSLDTINNHDRMDAVAESLFPLVHPQDNTGMLNRLAKGFPKDAGPILHVWLNTI